jgi:hypothetical protein
MATASPLRAMNRADLPYTLTSRIARCDVPVVLV